MNRIFLGTALVFFVVGSIELGSVILYRAIEHNWFSFGEAKMRRKALGINLVSNERKAQPNEVIHPYLGYVTNYADGRYFREKNYLGNYPVSDWGFIDDKNPVWKRKPSRLLVGVLGGSVALSTGFSSANRLKEGLRKIPKYAGKDIIIVSLANGGIKQPQQLLTLNYLMALGAEFDIIINIDGFNEVALPEVDNTRFGIFYAYPRAWRERLKCLFDIRDLSRSVERRRILKMALLRELYDLIPSISDLRFFKWSPTLNILSLSSQHIIERNLLDTVYRSGLMREPPTFEQSGPLSAQPKNENLYEEIAKSWAKSSILLHRLCSANGIRYYHFLQPNQYDPRSKRLSPSEMKFAYDPTHPYRQGVIKGYPYLKRSGRTLASRGVAFKDVSAMLKSRVDTLYEDTCCHLNGVGRDLLADTVVQFIQEREGLGSSEKMMSRMTGPSHVALP